MTNKQRTNRRVGCACHERSLLAAGAFTVAVFFYLIWHPGMYMTDQKNIELSVMVVAKDLQMAISAYKIETNRFPMPDDHATTKDLTVRSRGLLVSILIGENPGGLNPKEIIFIDPPSAKDQRSGLWRDGEEWVLNDRWGEPFYIILDTNGDGKIANPLLEAEAGLANGSPGSPLSEVTKSALVYSAGKDRDPKTLNDNIYAWKRH